MSDEVFGYSPEAEMGVIGSCLLSERCIEETAAIISPKHFWSIPHKTLYSKIIELHRQKIAVDMLTLKNSLNGQLEMVGGDDYIMAVAEFTPSPANAVHYARIVFDKWQARAYENLGKKALQGALPEELARLAQKIALEAASLNTKQLCVDISPEDFVPVELNYVWEPYLPKSKAVLLEAAPGKRKTAFLLSIAAALSQGKIPLTGEECKPVKTAYIHNFDDSNDELETVFRACGGKTGFLIKIQDPELRLNSDGIQTIDSVIKSHGIGLVIIDPLIQLLLGIVRNTADDLEVSRALTPFQQYWSTLEEVAIWTVRHARKGGTDLKKAGPITEQGMGSQMFFALFRGHQSIRAHTDPEKKNLMVFEDNKGSLLNRTGDYIIFERKGKYGYVEYLLDESNPFESGDMPIYQKQKACEEWLKNTLAKNQHYSVKNVMETAEKIGFSEKTVKRARKNLNVKTYKTSGDGGWNIYIPVTQEGLYDPYQDE